MRVIESNCENVKIDQTITWKPLRLNSAELESERHTISSKSKETDRDEHYQRKKQNFQGIIRKFDLFKPCCKY